MIGIRCEYEPLNGSADMELPWNIWLDVDEHMHAEYDFGTDDGVMAYLKAKGLAPFLKNTRGVRKHLRGARLAGYEVLELDCE